MNSWPRGARTPGALAAALFNLAGTGVGYALLGRWVRFAGWWVLLIGLVATAFATDAADSPVLWRLLFGGLAVAAAVDAAVLGRRQDRAQVAAAPWPPGSYPGLCGGAVWSGVGPVGPYGAGWEGAGPSSSDPAFAATWQGSVPPSSAAAPPSPPPYPGPAQPVPPYPGQAQPAPSYPSPPGPPVPDHPGSGWLPPGPFPPTAADRARRRRGVLLGAGALVLVAALLVGYVLGGAGVYTDGRGAQARADCGAAMDRFHLVDGVFELALSPVVPAARRAEVECVDFAGAVALQERQDWPDAVSAWRVLRATHPDTPLLPATQQRLQDALNDWALDRRSGADPAAAVSIYRDLLREVPAGPERERVRDELGQTYLEQAAALRTGPRTAAGMGAAFDALLIVAREFGDTPAAAAVPQAMTETYTVAVTDLASGDPCAAVPILSELIDLPDAETGGLGTQAKVHRAGGLLECGLGQLRAGQNGLAEPNLRAVVTEHADSPQLAQAQSALIAAQVGEARGVTVPVPAPLGGDTPGPIPIVFYNDSPNERVVRVAGATAHEFVLPPCPQCPAEYSTGATACPTFDGRPAKELRLAAGEYSVFSDTPATSTTAYTGTQVVEPNFTYTSCLYVSPTPPG